jgi:hypothetical protein
LRPHGRYALTRRWPGVSDQAIDSTGFGPKETCEFIKTTHHGETGTPGAISNLMTDPLILWAFKVCPPTGGPPIGKKAEPIPSDMRNGAPSSQPGRVEG